MELLVFFFNVDSLNIYLVKKNMSHHVSGLPKGFPIFLKAAEMWELTYRSYSINIYNNNCRD